MPDGGAVFTGQGYPALVLNADFRPVSYFPLSVWSWQDAVKAVFLDRVSVLSEYETRVHSPRLSMRLPTWENVCTACGPCNLRKGNHMPREINMVPRQEPRQPTSWELQENGRSFPPNYLHESWRDYLYWDSELEN